ncbi:MAG: multicopper oxidase domain-containing protein [Bacteroidetes bacterium]|jgi:blue copper oxidase|nr:multicopper oxidase domain-containing protein [Bacteroidota bacterium]HQW46037.1 multicopper oxidase domain-containing protein [Chitinophagaceae bacterium]MBK6821014.1 multicopper oxidase domain-containing protein [Bacteroidota bacterium]MBK7039198.1 multicopper oxidase domain-containing protein [Bacteroidota bacterium]MBK8329162.1 multicopper oxidase domain-containing protein [Bacteroidota bacterium]
MKRLLSLFLITFSFIANAQNLLIIPPALTGTSFNLNVQSGIQSFYTGINTPTYGINGPWMAPTIIVNKGDSITLNVINGLNVKTTMHWHGLHVAPENDGGPHQIIQPSTSWSPSFKIRNQAGTFWYHPHGAGQTDLQVSKGLAGFFIIHDADELALNIPQTYGVDDIPLVIQSKEFDILKQIAIAGKMDTALFVNGTLDPYYNAPAQVIRFRLLNGSSLRTYNFGLSNNQTFYQIATEGGIIDASLPLTRLRLSPGERAEILVNFTGMLGQTIYLKSFASELPNGIYGADTVGYGADTIHEYHDNFLNGADFDLLKITVVSPTAGAINSIPINLITYNPYNLANATNTRRIVMDTIRLLPADIPNRAEGPFGMNEKTFDMDSINEIVYLNTTEIWTLINKTLVAHPFHIHDVQFNIIEKSGLPPSASETGWKDVVLVMPGDSVKFLTKFDDFSNDTVPYMFHCHLLHHEDDGMMGSFVVIDSAWALNIQEITNTNDFSIYPNPTNNFWHINSITDKPITGYTLYSIGGEIIEKKQFKKSLSTFTIINTSLSEGQYILSIYQKENTQNFKLIKQ